MNKLIGLRKKAVFDLSKQASLSAIKESPWFWPGVGGAAGALLATPEIIDDMKENKARAIRTLLLSSGLGMGLGYVGDKIINSKQDLSGVIALAKKQIPR